MLTFGSLVCEIAIALIVDCCVISIKAAEGELKAFGQVQATRLAGETAISAFNRFHLIDSI